MTMCTVWHFGTIAAQSRGHKNKWRPEQIEFEQLNMMQYQKHSMEITISKSESVTARYWSEKRLCEANNKKTCHKLLYVLSVEEIFTIDLQIELLY